MAQTPPTPERIVEALLVVGGAPRAARRAAEVVRGLTAEGLRAAVDTLNRDYRRQGRPYAIHHGPDGYWLALKPTFRSVRDRLFGSVREARLSQPAQDVLALVAYRQPVTKSELDGVRGCDSGPRLRSLLKHGLVAPS